VDNRTFIGVGSNIGDGIAHCARGIKEISKDDRVSRLTASSFYSTSPVSPILQDDFINAAVAFAWAGSPGDLLQLLSRIEERMGRIRQEPWGPRIIDLDVLLLGDTVLDTPSLTIPHPELHRRKFALIPCLELEPSLMHPLYRKPLVSFLHEIDETQRVSISVSAEDVGRLLQE
jgi:2-amino-4-hydroxy-6-hydroxymethyldihydropteridine diphosphokinase